MQKRTNPAPTTRAAAPPARKPGGFFRGLAKASSTQSRAPFLSRPGTILVRVLRISAGVNRTDDAYFHVDVEVIHKLAAGTLPDEIRKMNTAAVAAGTPDKVVDAAGHEKGEKLAWRVRVHGEWKEIQLGNIKNMVEAILTSLGEDSFEEWGDEEWEAAIFDETNGVSGPEQPARGLLLIGTTDARVTKKGGVVMVTTWTPGEDVARDLIEQEVLTVEECGLDGSEQAQE